jgi:CRP-like cAMP-binding protein
MQTTTKIHTKNVTIGMYVSGLDTGWEDTPFPLQGFLIANEQQLKKLQQCCEYVEIDKSRSIKTLALDAAFTNKTGSTDNRLTVKTRLPDIASSDLKSVPLPRHAETIADAPGVEFEFFITFGVMEAIASNVILFGEGQKPNRLLWQHNKMYLLVKGEVGIFVDGKNVNTIKAGEIFGELTPLILAKRSATVVTNSHCEVLSLTENQFVNGLEKNPEFALVLMNILVRRLRQAVDDAKSLGLPIEYRNNKSIRVFSGKMLSELLQKVDVGAVTHIRPQQTIFRRGAIGMLMYVILEGRVITCFDDKIVEHSGPGCVIGEIALVDQQHRLARVVADTDCSLLAIDRQVFLELVKNEPAFSISLLRTLASRLRFWRTGEAF